MVWRLAAVLLGLGFGVQTLRLWLLRRSLREITEDLSRVLETETNGLLTVSSRDRSVKRLALELNGQLRQLRAQRQRYLSGDRELKEAVTNLSHDLRTPLTAICGYLDLLETAEKSEAAARYLGFIENRVEAMKLLTEELLRSSVVLSAQEPHREPVELKALLEESLASFYAGLTERGITPRVELPEGPVVRQLDRLATARIYANILSNALKYSGGDLSVTLYSQGEAVFENAAPGLDEVQVEKLFNRFFTVEASRSSTGLGLAIAKKLTEQQGGTIHAQLDRGRLRIRVIFPEK